MGMSTGFHIFLLIHILAAVVAFGGNFVQPALARGGADDESLARINLFVQLPAVVVLFIAGMGAVGFSDEIFKFSQSWISIAFLVAIVAGVLQFLVGRAYQGGKKDMIPMLNGCLHLCLVIALFLMIWKPGL